MATWFLIEGLHEIGIALGTRNAAGHSYNDRAVIGTLDLGESMSWLACQSKPLAIASTARGFWFPDQNVGSVL